MCRDDRPANGQSDAQAMAFRGEEWLENPADIATRHSAALVLYRHAHRVRLQIGGNPEYSILLQILRHCITCIGDNVKHDLLKLHLIARNIGQPSASVVRTVTPSATR